MKPRDAFLEKLHKIDKTLARITKTKQKKKKRTQINKIKNERRDITMIPQKHLFFLRIKYLIRVNIQNL